MTRTDAAAFSKGMQALGETFDTPVSELRTATYFDALADLELRDVLRAMRGLIRTHKFFPKPVEIREAIHGTPADLTESAWMLWKRAARKVGGAASLVVTDAVLAETLVTVFGGWPEACYAEFSPEMWAAKRKEFERVYRVFVERGIRGSRYLKGAQEIQNGALLKFTPVGAIDGNRVRVVPPGERQALLAAADAPAESMAELP